ncbi:MAG: hypothetical protein WC438_04190 [Candidatus Pacearchaeota archaeon]
MNFTQLLKKIESSKIFERFKSEHPDAELVVGFFILDFTGNDSKQTLDYKTDHKIFTFSLENEDITFQEDKLIDSPNQPPLQKLNTTIKIDLDKIPELAKTTALDYNIQNKFQKIIAVLQKHEGKETWNLTCMLDSLAILHILIDANTEEIIKFEKKSMMDFMKKV